jgi:hypothetical protein
VEGSLHPEGHGASERVLLDGFRTIVSFKHFPHGTRFTYCVAQFLRRGAENRSPGLHTNRVGCLACQNQNDRNIRDSIFDGPIEYTVSGHY